MTLKGINIRRHQAGSYKIFDFSLQQLFTDTIYYFNRLNGIRLQCFANFLAKKLLDMWWNALQEKWTQMGCGGANRLRF